MNHTPDDIIRFLLISLDIGTAPIDGLDWPINASKEPDVPDNCITIYTTTSKEEGRLQQSGEPISTKGIQTRVRSSNYLQGWRKISAIDELYNKTIYNNSVTIDGSVYLVHAIVNTSDPIPLQQGLDVPTSQRRIFVANAFVRLRQVS